jgi:hypothetical protein
MAVYLKLTATAVIKIQDPYDSKTIEDAKEETCIHCQHELCEEDYKYEVVDAD